jgi:hypothetical protein
VPQNIALRLFGIGSEQTLDSFDGRNNDQKLPREGMMLTPRLTRVQVFLGKFEAVVVAGDPRIRCGSVTVQTRPLDVWGRFE